MSKKVALVVVAHPDDEVLGCGGMIAKLSKKNVKVNILIISDGISSRKISKSELVKEIKNRRAACKKACKVLGAQMPIFYDLPDNQLDSVPLLKIIKIVDDAILKYKPETVLTHYNDDLNIDHRIVNKAVVTACRPQKNSSVKTLLFFEIPSSTEWQINRKKFFFTPNWYEDISKTIKFKLKALKVYQSELRKWPHPRSIKGIRALAEWRGATAGYKAAEAFVLGRKK